MARERRAKEPVKLRQRRIANGNITLYLDIYWEGRRDYEFLRLYLVPEVTREDREQNRQTLALASAIKAKRITELQDGTYGVRRTQASIYFYEYFRSLCEKRLGTEGRGNWGNWFSCLHHLLIYDGREKLTFEKVTPEWVQGFRDYLDREAVAWSHDYRKRIKDRPLSRNTKQSYFNKLKACLNQAVEDGIITRSPARSVESFKAEEGTRMYLTIAEIQKLARTDCEYEGIKKAFLFSCLTGLRRSDVMRLRWGDVHRQGDFTRIFFRQKKTKEQEYLDITQQAAELMGESGEAEDMIFSDVHTASCTNRVIQEWVLRAGINKKITFHCARHTFAVMMLDLGTDIYTVSKLLGHRQLSTTQIYARVLDKNKQAAVASIPDILGLSTIKPA